MSYPIIRQYTDFCFLEEEKDFLKKIGLPMKGVVHIGAHTCEEKGVYNQLGIPDQKIVWIEGNKDLCDENIRKGIPNVYNALISDTEKEVTFHITDFKASSSIYPLYVHSLLYPHIKEAEGRKARTMSLQTFFSMYSLNPSDYNIWSLDIQGAELDALRGAGNLLENVDLVFSEINFKEMYKDIPLIDSFDPFMRSKGFTMTHIKVWQNSWGDVLYVKNKYLET